MVKYRESGSRISGRMTVVRFSLERREFLCSSQGRPSLPSFALLPVFRGGALLGVTRAFFFSSLRGSSQLQGWTVSSDSVKSGLLEKVGR